MTTNKINFENATREMILDGLKNQVKKAVKVTHLSKQGNNVPEIWMLQLADYTQMWLHVTKNYVEVLSKANGTMSLTLSDKETTKLLESFKEKQKTLEKIKNENSDQAFLDFMNKTFDKDK